MEAAAYHDAAEVITGDLATPIKYFNPGIQEAYRTVEAMAEKKLMDMLPSELRPTFQSLFQMDEETLSLIHICFISMPLLLPLHLFTIVKRVACSSLIGYPVHRYIVSISVWQRSRRAPTGSFWLWSTG